jgi:hypothetical protein
MPQSVHVMVRQETELQDICLENLKMLLSNGSRFPWFTQAGLQVTLKPQKKSCL